MKKLIITLLCLTSFQARAQFSAAILQTLDTAYLSIARIAGSSYLAALRQDALDIRQTAIPGFGIRVQTVSLPGITISGGIEAAGNYVYAMNYTLTPVDLTNPNAPITGSTITLPAAMMSHVHWGSWLYVAANNGKCYIYSLANPMAPLLADSLSGNMSVMKCLGNKLFSIPSYGNKLYSWVLSASAPYISPSDSVVFPAVGSAGAIDIYGTQLVYKNYDSLYRFRITAAGSLLPLSAEILPAYPYNGSLFMRDTNIIGYARYNSFFVSSGIMGNTFIDSAQIMVDGNYTVSYGALDDNLYYTNTARTYLVGFFGNSISIAAISLIDAISILPNPATNSIAITLDKAGCYRIIVRDLMGRSIIEKQVAEGQHQLNVSELTTGTYIIDIENQILHMRLSHKFIKL